MARKPRIHFPGAVYHVILRGNAGQPIFFDDRDRYRFYLFMQCIVEKFGCRIHGFCLMSNHAHLVVQTGDIPLSRIMQNFSLRYTKWINKAHSRTGHVFQGRYKALLLDADAYLLALVRYVHLNPVRGGMVAFPGDYRWSGHHGYLGKEVLPWLTTDWVLSMFGTSEPEARNAYAQFVLDGVGEGRCAEFHSGTCEGRILGDDDFADLVCASANQPRVKNYGISEVLSVVCQSYGMTLEQLRVAGKAMPFAEARAVAAVLVLESSQIQLVELGKLLNRDIAPLGRVGRRLMGAALDDEDLRSRIDGLRDKLTK